MENYQLSDGSELQIKYTCRVSNFLYGPYYKHNILVHCGSFLQNENCINSPKKRFWPIFFFGGKYSKISDVMATVWWYIFLLYPVTASLMGFYLRNKVNIINAVILSLFMMYHLVCIFLITKNTTTLKQLWYITKLNLEKYVGLENVIRHVNLTNISDLDLIPFEKRKKISQKLYQQTDPQAIVMLCTKSFWRSCLIDPVVCLVVAAILCLVSVLIQLETISGDYFQFQHT